MNFDYIKKYYGVPAEIGSRIIADGKPGTIVEDRGNYIGVVLDGCKATDIRPYHPTWRIQYLGMGAVPKMTRSQSRYREYLHAETGESFIEYLKRQAVNR